MSQVLVEPLAVKAAETLGYTLRGNFMPGLFYNREWVGSMNGEKLLKGQMFPSIRALPRSIEIIQPTYSVTFYLDGTKNENLVVDGPKIFGWGGDEFPIGWDALAKVMIAWGDNRIYQAFLRKYQFLKREPGYRLLPKQSRSGKKYHASQVEV